MTESDQTYGVSATTRWPDWLRYSDEETSRDLDVAFARLLADQAPQAGEPALRLAMLCSAQLAQGHSCLDIQPWYPAQDASRDTTVSSMTGSDAGGIVRPRWLPPDLADCLAALARAPFVGDGSGDEPLVLHGTRLYLARYWRAGLRIRQTIAMRLSGPSEDAADPRQARDWLDRLFPAPSDMLDWQKLACAVALLRRFSIVTGGPGTGKTTTVVRLLAVLQGLALARGRAQGLRIRLAAPTGKAAARLNESIAGKLRELADTGDDALRAALACVPSQVVTLHRLLGSRPGTRRLAHDAGRPLDLDVLVIDEASMMDIEMMDAVLAALPADARLILLGDKDQLASVEAGAVLGELCARAEGGHYWMRTCEQLAALSGQDLRAAARDPALSGVEAGLAHWPDDAGTELDQAVVMLRRSMRFGPDSGIGQFATAVNRGRMPTVRELLDKPPADLRCIRHAGSAASHPADVAGFSAEVGLAAVGEREDWLTESGVLGTTGYPALFTLIKNQRPPREAPMSRWDAWALSILAQQTRFQVLCAVREGPWGVQGLNQRIESRLRAAGLVLAGPNAWYAGRPVLVRRNLPVLGLANGDIGVALPVPDPGRADGWTLRVAFAGAAQGAVRWVSPARLPAIETVYALTVHKSQGSEFDQVVLVLPDVPGPLVTRELLYTGVTRARRSLALVLPGGDAVLRHAVLHPTRRAGGVWNP
ncbi:exodeoxyribonuclease V subunit alpha [Castellaniella sp. MT123]|uniref:exodeoxyribonuclease V subunit alpha n=1 Tax=Castellaniella sp. MT123 TaxID=3140381 RepID=UPI0031F42322